MQTKFKQIETLWWLEDKFLEDPSFHHLFINISGRKDYADIHRNGNKLLF